MRVLSKPVAFAVLIALAAPASALAALSRQTLDGTWESPWPADVLPNPARRRTRWRPPRRR